MIWWCTFWITPKIFVPCAYSLTLPLPPFWKILPIIFFKQLTCVKLIPTGIPCYVDFENIGCFSDNHVEPRPLPQLLFTDADTQSELYSGIPMELGQLDRYLSDVACRCAANADKLQFEYFGIQNYGKGSKWAYYMAESVYRSVTCEYAFWLAE